MPYIEKESRKIFDVVVEQLRGRIVTVGELNYVITRICVGFLKAQPRVGYAQMNEVVGVLECAKQEMYRRCMAGYEDKKKEQNGDVYDDLAK